MSCVVIFSLVIIGYCGYVVVEGLDLQDSCPDVCSCLGNAVDCSDRQLDHPPHQLPQWTEVLDLSSNGLTTLSSLNLSGMRQLEELDLSKNKLMNLSEDFFENVSPARLKILRVSGNKLQSITGRMKFSNLNKLFLDHNELTGLDWMLNVTLPQLRTADLSFNNISRIKSGMLSNIKSIQVLSLNGNNITDIDSEAFEQLKELENLKLQRNQLSSLQLNLFINLNNLRILQLDYNNLSKINDALLSGLENLKRLSLSHNRVSVVEDGAWSSSTKLVELDLSYNELKAITTNTFRYLESLSELQLSNNKISSIGEFCFRDLHSLRSLNLSVNNLSSGLEKASSTFVGLLSLTKLSLAHNNIKIIIRAAFNGAREIRQLNLEGNNISSIQQNPFESLKSLSHMLLNTSNLICDCDLAWLPEFLRKSEFRGRVRSECGYPSSLIGRSIPDLDLREFQCGDHAGPVVRESPRSGVIVRGEGMNLTCAAKSSSDDLINIDWMKDNIKLEAIDSKITLKTSRVVGNSSYQYRSDLVLSSVADEDAGVYQCRVENRFGSVLSAKAKINIGVLPTFTKLPLNVTLKEGATARLQCAAVGHPQPEIVWQKDGGFDFPAARERRMHVLPLDDVFFIVEAKSEDEGLYTCTARNQAGAVRANATLVVTKGAAVSKSSGTKESTVGETVVLECPSSTSSSGSRVEWYLEGGRVASSTRHHFVADGQLMIITEAKLEDSGQYTCVFISGQRSEGLVIVLDVTQNDSGSLRGEEGEESGVASVKAAQIGAVVVMVVVCVVMTSLLWIIIIFCLRKRRKKFTQVKNNKEKSGVRGSGDHVTDRNLLQISPLLLFNKHQSAVSPGEYNSGSCATCLDSGCYCSSQLIQTPTYDSSSKHSDLKQTSHSGRAQCNGGGESVCSTVSLPLLHSTQQYPPYPRAGLQNVVTDSGASADPATPEDSESSRIDYAARMSLPTSRHKSRPLQNGTNNKTTVYINNNNESNSHRPKDLNSLDLYHAKELTDPRYVNS